MSRGLGKEEQKKRVASSGWGKVAAPLALNVVARVEGRGGGEEAEG